MLPDLVFQEPQVMLDYRVPEARKDNKEGTVNQELKVLKELMEEWACKVFQEEKEKKE